MPKKTIHWKRDHIDNEGRLVCPVEGCGWKSKPNLKTTSCASEHYRRKHKFTETYKCSVPGCKKKFSSSVEQRQHITRHEYRIRKKEDEGIGSDSSTGDESDCNKEIVCPKIYDCPHEGCDYSDCLLNNVRAHYGRKHLGKSKDNITISINEDTQKKYYKCNHCGIEKNHAPSIYYHLSACLGPYTEKYVIKKDNKKKVSEREKVNYISNDTFENVDKNRREYVSC